MNDGKLSPYFQNIVDENVGLIRSIPSLKLAAFKNQLVSLITQDATQKTVREAIQKNFNLTRGRASLIARDQTAKLNGALTKYRQQQLGIGRYFWRRTRDRRCREIHRKLGEQSDRGKTFSWDKPPIADASGKRGHPGELWQCRCWAEADFREVLE
jgi:SPP1 gp7 family putative phage head morphogenesis protein